MYNVGGAMNRGCCSRANQNGPEMYGFRGNARNLDLNRDFIKADSKNVRSFYKAFQKWQPDFFVDTHASNGADYQYTMTLIATQRNKIHPNLGGYMDSKLVPYLYSDMKQRGYEMSPYVHQLGTTPDEKGIKDYLETPRYSTGYAALFNCMGFVTETHMWKPYPERVKSTYEFLISLLTYANAYNMELAELKDEIRGAQSNQENYPLNWVLDTTTFQTIKFKGYKSKTKKSNITGLDRLYYDRGAPYTKSIPYYNTYRPVDVVKAPKAYIIPQAYSDVVQLLQINGIQTYSLKEDVTVNVESYYIADMETRTSPYEGHYLHYNTQVQTVEQEISYRKGDVIVYVDQPFNRFIVETLEPAAADSYFNWNFFDNVLQQKEWFSDYIFEDLAEEVLEENPDLKAGLEELKKDPETAKNHWALLYYVYKNSKYYEPTHMRYPIGRFMENRALK